MERGETVRDVCDEIEDLQGAGNGGGAIELYGDEIDARDLSARIIAAHEREVEAKDAVHHQRRENYHAQLAEKDAEIARLKAVLKPVMECNPNMEYSDYHCTLAVREAQRIAKEGGVA